MNAFRKLFSRNKTSDVAPPEEVKSPTDESAVGSFGDCEEKTALINQAGQLCSVLDVRYVMTTVDHVPLLVPVESDVMNNWKLNHFVWDKNTLRLHEYLPDGTAVCFDAVRASESTGYQILFMWIGSKPDKIVLPVDGSALLLESHADVMYSVLNDSKSLSVMLHNRTKSLPMPCNYWQGEVSHSVDRLESSKSLKLSILEVLSEQDGVFNYSLVPRLYLDGLPRLVTELEPMRTYRFNGDVLRPSSSDQILYLDAPVLRDGRCWQLTLRGEKTVLTECYQFCSNVRHTMHAAHVLHRGTARHCRGCLIGSSPRKISSSESFSSASVALKEITTSPSGQNVGQSNPPIEKMAINENSGDLLMAASIRSEPDMPQADTTCNKPDMPQADTTCNKPDMPQADTTCSKPDMPQADTTCSTPDMPQADTTCSKPDMLQVNTTCNKPHMSQVDHCSTKTTNENTNVLLDDVEIKTVPSDEEGDSELKYNSALVETLSSQDAVEETIESACKSNGSISPAPSGAEHESVAAIRESPNCVVNEATEDLCSTDAANNCIGQHPARGSPPETTGKVSLAEEPIVKEERSETAFLTESGALHVALAEASHTCEEFSDSGRAEVCDSVFNEINRSFVSDDEDGKSVEYKSASEGSFVEDGAPVTEQDDALDHERKASESLSGGEQSAVVDAAAFDALPRATVRDAGGESASVVDNAIENEHNSNDLADETEVSSPSAECQNDQSENNGSELGLADVVNCPSGEVSTTGKTLHSAHELPVSISPEFGAEVAKPPCSPSNCAKLELEEYPPKLVGRKNLGEDFTELSTLLAMFRAQGDVIHDDPIVKCLDDLFDHLMKNCPKPACFGSSFACDQGEDVYVVPNCKEFRGFAVADDVFALAHSARYALVKCKLQNLYILCPVGELPPMPLFERVSVLFCKASLSPILGVNVAYGVMAWNLDDPPVLLHHSCEVHSLTVGVKARMDHIAAYSFTNQGVPIQECAMGTNVRPPLNESVMSSLNFFVVPARIVAFQKLFLHVYVDSLEFSGHSKCRSENVFLRRVKKNITKILEGQCMNTNVFAIVSSNELVCVYDELAPKTCIHFCSEHQPTLMVSSDNLSSTGSSSLDALSSNSLTNSPDLGFVEANVQEEPCNEDENASDEETPVSVSAVSLDPSLDSGKHTIVREGSSKELVEENEKIQDVEVSQVGSAAQPCASEFIERETVSLESNIVNYGSNYASDEEKFHPENLSRDDQTSNKGKSPLGSSHGSLSGADATVSDEQHSTMCKTEQQLNENYSNTEEVPLEVSPSENQLTEKTNSLIIEERDFESHFETHPNDFPNPSSGEADSCDQIIKKDASKAPEIQKDIQSDVEVLTKLITEKDIKNWSKIQSTHFACSIHLDQLMNNCALLKTMSCKIILPYFNLFDATNVLKMIVSSPERKFSVNTICLQLEKPLFLRGRLVTHVAVFGYLGTKPGCVTNIINHWSTRKSILHSDLFEMLSLYLPVGCENRVVLGKVVMMGRKYGVLRFSIVPNGLCYYVRFEASALRYASNGNTSVVLGDCFMKTCFASIRLDETAPPDAEIRFLSADVLVGSLQQLRSRITNSTDVTLLYHVLFFQGENDETSKPSKEYSPDNIWRTEVERLITSRVEAIPPGPVVEPVVEEPAKCHVLDEELPVVYVATDYVVLERKNNSFVFVPMLNLVEWISKDSFACTKIAEFLKEKVLRVLHILVSEAVIIGKFSITHFGLAAYVRNSVPAILDTVPNKWRSEVNVPSREVEALVASFSAPVPNRPSVPVNATVMYATDSDGILSFVDFQKRPHYASVSCSDLSFYLEEKPIQSSIGSLTLKVLVGKPLKAIVAYRSRLLLLSYETREVKISTLKSFLSNSDATISSDPTNELNSAQNTTDAHLTSKSVGDDSAPVKTAHTQKSLWRNTKLPVTDVGSESDAKLNSEKKSRVSEGGCASPAAVQVSVKNETPDSKKSPTPVASTDNRSVNNFEIVKIIFDLSVKDAFSMLKHLGLGECSSSSKVNHSRISHYVVKTGEFYDNFVLFETKVCRIILPFENYVSGLPLQQEIGKRSLSVMCINLPFSLHVGSVEMNSYGYFAYFGKKPVCGKVFEKYISTQSTATLQQLARAACARMSSNITISAQKKTEKLQKKVSPPSASASPAKSNASKTTLPQVGTATTSSTLNPSSNSQGNTKLAVLDTKPITTVPTGVVKTAKESTLAASTAVINVQNAGAKVKQPKTKAKKKTAEKEPAPSAPTKKTSPIPVSSASATENSSKKASAKKSSPPPTVVPKAQTTKTTATSDVAQKRDVIVGKDKSGASASQNIKNPTTSNVKSRTSAVFSKVTASEAGKMDADATSKPIKAMIVTNRLTQASKTDNALPTTASQARLLTGQTSQSTLSYREDIHTQNVTASQPSSASTSNVHSAKSSARSSPVPAQDALSHEQYLLMPEPWEYLDSAVVMDNYSDFSRIKTKDGTVLMFQPKQCYLYGVSLEGLQLWHVLVQGLPVRYSLRHDESPTSTPSVARVYVGAEDVSRTPPLILQQFISDWCEEKCVSAADSRLLAYRASLMKGLT